MICAPAASARMRPGSQEAHRKKSTAHHWSPLKKDDIQEYPLVNQHNYGKSPFLMGKLTINGHFQ
jgi:hypothetical protein